jgi:hypothetical protein
MNHDQERVPAGDSAAAQTQASDPTLTRKEFIKKIVTRGVAAGTLIVGCQIVDKFVVPPAYAQTSGGAAAGCDPAAVAACAPLVCTIGAGGTDCI